MPPPGVHAHASQVGTRMRSFLFVPADSSRKLDKALGCGADAVIIDLEDSIAPEHKVRARVNAAAFLKEARAREGCPQLLVRVHSLATGMTDDDPDAVIPATPDA